MAHAAYTLLVLRDCLRVAGLDEAYILDVLDLIDASELLRRFRIALTTLIVRAAEWGRAFGNPELDLGLLLNMIALPPDGSVLVCKCFTS